MWWCQIVVYTSHDPRKLYRESIGIEIDDLDTDKSIYYIRVEDDELEDIDVPMYISEEIKTQELPTMPFIELHLASSMSEPHDIGASTRKKEARIDISIWYTDTDNIDATSFGKKIADAICHLTRTYQCSVSNIDFMNITNEGRVMVETQGRQVVFHLVMELYVLYYDGCD